MNQREIDEFTKDWKQLDENGNVELYSFFDKVDWAEKYAIKVNGEVKTTFDKDEGNPYTIFKIVSECFTL